MQPEQHTATPHASLVIRALLFAPADSARKMERAMAEGADAVIVDLEDSVAEGAKASARDLLTERLTAPRQSVAIVRVNAEDTAFHLDDLAQVMRSAPDALMLPKCAGPKDLRRLADRLDVLERAFAIPSGSTGILPLVSETAAALSRLEYAGVTPRLVALGFAAEDLAADLGLAARQEGRMNPLLDHARRAVAIAAATAGVPAIDTPFPNPLDPEGLLREAQAAVALGFGGKLCIHPSQVAPVIAAFSPPPDRIDWAQAVIAALGGAGAPGVAVVEGRMVDAAHLRLARRVLAMTGGT